MNWLKLPLVFFFLLNCFHTQAQDAIIFDSLNYQYSFLTEDAIYINSNKLVKADYSGNIIWAKSGTICGHQLKVEANGVYVFWKDTLTKLDTAGSVIWSKILFQPVCPILTSGNEIADIVINDDRIYILCNQNDVFSYPSLITIDTNGSVINTWCGGIDYRDVRFEKGVRRLSGGAWLAMYDGGNVHTGMSLPVDRDGNVLTNSLINLFGYPGAQFNKPLITLNLNNSSHCYIVDSWGGSIVFGYPSAFFESDNGTNHYAQSYSDTGSLYYRIISATSDSADNIYMLGWNINDQAIFQKINSQGMTLFAKEWSGNALMNYQLGFDNFSGQVQSIYRNDSLFLLCRIEGKPALITLDNSLNSTCYSPDLTIQIDPALPLFIDSIQNYYSVDSINYIPANLVVSPQNTFLPGAIRKCVILDIASDEDISNVMIYPNPVSDFIFVSGLKREVKILLTNPEGKFINVPAERNGETLIIKASLLQNGIYFLRLTERRKVIQKIISIQH